MKNINTWKLIDRCLAEKVPVMLLYVLESRGSSPGRQGFFMAVNANDEMEGSIGGGVMEHKFVELAKNSLRSVIGSREREHTIKKQVHDKSAAKDRSGMICSGEQTILLYEVKEEEVIVVQKIIGSLEQNKCGMLILSPGKMAFDDITASNDFEFAFQSEEDWLYREKTGYKNQLSIIGGGHCALAFSRLMRSLDFYIRVYDERKDLKTMLENDAAHEKYFINDYSELKNRVIPANNHYAVIMTFGYRTDDIALRSVLDKDFKYLGLLGSRNKIEKMLDGYKKEGIPEERLQRIHTPVGLAIKSQTPEEIAVSIAAEIIKVKNRDL